MKPQTALIKLRLRLNKSHSSDMDNIPDWKAIEAINKAQLEFVRRLVHGNNQHQEGDEETRMRVDDLQVLLTTKLVKGFTKKLYFESDVLPDNYLYYKALIPKATLGQCAKVPFYSTLVEEANVPRYLNDWSMKPSMEWRTTFHTLAGNRVRVYTNGEFSIEELTLTYFRRPQRCDIAGYPLETGGNSSDSDLEFKDDVCELILDEAASILAADVEMANAYEATKTRVESNN